jgi:hypothetical protein
MNFTCLVDGMQCLVQCLVLVITHLYMSKHQASSKHTHDLQQTHKQISLIELGAMTLSRE